MTTRSIGEPPSKSIDGNDHRSILAMLPEYVMICVLGQQPAQEWQVLEQHLAHCATCRSEADALRELMAETYAGSVPAVPAPAPPDLAFLDQPLTRQTGSVGRAYHPHDHKPTTINDFRPIVIQFSAALLPRIRVQMAARTGGVRLRYSYEIPSTDDASPTISVEVLVRDDQPDRGLVRVCVEHPGRSPFDQAGSRVNFQIEDMDWSAMTDQNGVAAFHDVPLDQIERWQITVAPPESGEADR